MTFTGEYILKKGIAENDFSISGNYSFNVIHIPAVST